MSSHLVGFLSAFAAILIGIAGCSSSQPNPTTNSQKRALANFDLSKCETIQPSLYRCPGSDKPLCDPDFARNDVECVKVTKSGHVILPKFGG